MKVKVNEASGPTLDWMVAKCEFTSHVLRFQRGPVAAGYVEDVQRFKWVKGRYTPCVLSEAEHLYEPEVGSYYCPSTSWGIGGPILDREDIQLTGVGAFRHARYRNNQTYFGPTPLIAAMRCYVASKLGGVVEVPDELAGCTP